MDIKIHRDKYGIPHIETASESDAWYAMGYASAQDRLWQMEWYRRRGTGRWSEIVGPDGMEADRLFKRFRLDAASIADDAALTSETREMFQMYSDGVNAFVDENALPYEYALTGTPWERWENWHSILVFKVRHVIMGKQLTKIARLNLLHQVGAETMAMLDGEPPGGSVILPPAGVTEQAVSLGQPELERALHNLGTLAIEDGGSNSWAVHGSRTSTGKPIICNDSHRPLDVPNVYWQCHVICPEFNVAGAAFPGVPAFPHFGFNGEVAWNITHGSADYTDVWVEEFRDDSGTLEYKDQGNWLAADIENVIIGVKDHDDISMEVVSTRRGSVIHGDPRAGAGISMRYTATDRINGQWESLRPMLRARTVMELNETQDIWEEPVNNLVSADTADNISYLYRGRIPIRTDVSGRVYPGFGAEGKGNWLGDVPRIDLPQAVNPPEGFIATSNQSPWAKSEPFLSHEFSVPSRAERLAELLGDDQIWNPEDVVDLQGDVTSVPARRWAEYVAALPESQDRVEQARLLLAGWDGELSSSGPQGLLYTCLRDTLIEQIYRPILGDDAWTWIQLPVNASARGIVARWFYGLGQSIENINESQTVDGRKMSDILTASLEIAWSAAAAIGGADPNLWRWGDHHRTNAKHTLSPVVGEKLNPPDAEMGGDGDTVQVSSIDSQHSGDDPAFPVGALSVYRQVVDFNDPTEGWWIIPGGASGISESQHHSDQLRLWETHQLIPMLYRLDRVLSEVVSTQTMQR
jgi:penicillin amidase